MPLREMKRTLLIITLCLSTFLVSAQTEKQADLLFQDKHYEEALAAYKHLLKRSPKNQLYLYRTARCLEETSQTEEAITFFEKAGDRYDLKHLHLAMLYQRTYRFTQAIDEYEAYLLCLKDEDQKKPIVDNIDYCRKAEKMLRHVSDLSIIDSTTVSKDKILSAYTLSSESGQLSVDSLLFSYTNQRQDRIVLTKPQADGRLALYWRQRLLDLWSEDEPMPEPIRSDAQENSPFMLSDGITLYFASDRDAGLGGWDIYMTRQNTTTGAWYEPENLGFPFNSQANDYLLCIDETNNIGFFATDRYSKEGYVTVYRFYADPETRIFHGSDDEVRRRAMLKAWSTPTPQEEQQQQEEEIEEEESTPTQEQTGRQPLFIVNDKLIYYSENDFTSDNTRSLFKLLQQTREEIDREKRLLDRLRKEYAGATPARRQELHDLILVNEQTLRNLISDEQQQQTKLREDELRERRLR